MIITLAILLGAALCAVAFFAGMYCGASGVAEYHAKEELANLDRWKKHFEADTQLREKIAVLDASVAALTHRLYGLGGGQGNGGAK